MEELTIGITSAIVAVIGAFMLNYLRDKSEEKEKLKVWKIIIYKELVSQKKKVLNIKKVIEKGYLEKNKNKILLTLLDLIDISLITNNRVYDYDFAGKTLGKDFNKYVDYIKKWKFLIKQWNFVNL